MRPPVVDRNKFILICERYAETGLAMASCEDLGVNFNSVKTAIADQLARGDDSWRELWTESYDKFRESLERAIVTRGRDGTPTKWRVNPETGERTATEWTFSDRLLELAARGHFPERYRTNVAVSGTMGLEPVDAFSNLSPGAKREIRAIIMRDLEEQRLAAQLADRAATIEGDFSERPSDALADMRRGEDKGDSITAGEVEL